MKILINTENGVRIMTLLYPAQLGAALAAQGSYVDWKEIKEAEIPADRTFRDAWKYDGVGIVVDMDTASQIQAVRLVREAMKIEQGQRIAQIMSDPMIASAKTPAELKLAIPEALTE
jgi:hypothetical protein